MTESVLRIIGALLVLGIVASVLGGSLLPLAIVLAASWATWALAKGLDGR